MVLEGKDQIFRFYRGSEEPDFPSENPDREWRRDTRFGKKADEWKDVRVVISSSEAPSSKRHLRDHLRLVRCGITCGIATCNKSFDVLYDFLLKLHCL